MGVEVIIEGISGFLASIRSSPELVVKRSPPVIDQEVLVQFLKNGSQVVLILLGIAVVLYFLSLLNFWTLSSAIAAKISKVFSARREDKARESTLTFKTEAPAVGEPALEDEKTEFIDRSQIEKASEAAAVPAAPQEPLPETEEQTAVSSDVLTEQTVTLAAEIPPAPPAKDINEITEVTAAAQTETPAAKTEAAPPPAPEPTPPPPPEPEIEEEFIPPPVQVNAANPEPEVIEEPKPVASPKPEPAPAPLQAKLPAPTPPPTPTPPPKQAVPAEEPEENTQVAQDIFGDDKTEVIDLKVLQQKPVSPAKPSINQKQIIDDIDAALSRDFDSTDELPIFDTQKIDEVLNQELSENTDPGKSSP